MKIMYSNSREKSNRLKRRSEFQMFSLIELISGLGEQHGVSILSSINFSGMFRQLFPC